MATEWICYLDNKEFGPIGEGDLLELLRDGTVPVNTYIRRPSDTEWTTIEKIFGPNILKQTESGPKGALSPAAESKFFSDSPTLVNLRSSSGEIWYWSVQGETFGPGRLEDVIHLKEQGLIGPDDYLCLGQDGEWKRAGTVDALFPAPTSFVDSHRVTPSSLNPAGGGVVPALPSSPSPNIQTHSAAMLADETKLLQQLLELLQQNPNLSQMAANPIQQVPQSSIPVDQQWFCMVSGQQVGPVTIETLVQMVLQGRIFPSDLIRLGSVGEWFPASSVEGLFPKAGSSPSQVHISDSKAGLTPNSGETRGEGSQIENLRKIPESELVIQGLERLYKASEEAAVELAEIAKKKEKAGDKKDGPPPAAQAANASRKAANDIIKNYSQFALSSAEKKKKQAEADKKSPMEQFQENKMQIIGIVVALLIALVVFVLTSGVLDEY